MKNWCTRRGAADSTYVFSLLATMFSMTTTLQLDTTKSLIAKKVRRGCGLGPIRYRIAIASGSWFLSLPPSGTMIKGV